MSGVNLWGANQNFGFNPSGKISEVTGGRVTCVGSMWGSASPEKSLLLGFQVLWSTVGHHSASELLLQREMRRGRRMAAS